MKNSVKGCLFALIAFVSILPSRVCANHIVGADISWKHYSADTSLFTASVYRSCTGMKLANSPFTYFGNCAGYKTPKLIYGSLGLSKDVTPGNYGCDQCSDPTCSYQFGIEIITEDVKIAFPSGCCDWFVSWSQNYRDGSINTIASGEPLYIEAEINTCLSRPDNSPTFNAPANNIFCVGQCNTMDNSAIDIDKHDSLVYSLVAPLQSHGKNVSYDKGYSYIKPMKVPADSAACIGFYLNPRTGVVQFEPKLLEISVIAIQVDEWRADTNGNYQKIGSVRRDIEMYVTNCFVNPDTVAPIIPGINGGNSFSAKICGDGSTCFDVKAFDLYPPDSVKLTWKDPGNMPGATFLVIKDGKKWPTATFCWYPKDSMARTQPYTFTVIAKNNENPPDSSFKTFSVYVGLPSKATYSATIVKGACGLVNFKASPAPNSPPIASYLWVGDGSSGYGPLYINGQVGTYQYSHSGWTHYTLIITSAVGGCSVNYPDSIYLNPYLEIKHQDTIVCAKSPSIKLSEDVKFGTPPYSYLWSTGETTQTKNAFITKDTFFRITVTDYTGCSNYDSIHVHFLNPLPPKPATVVYKCANSSTQLTSSDISSQVTWTAIIRGKIMPGFSDSNLLTVSDTGIYIATAKNSSICPGVDSFIVKPISDSINNQRNIHKCFGNKFIIDLLGKSWIDSGNNWMLIAATSYPFVFTLSGLTNPTGYKFKSLVNFTYHGYSCMDTLFTNLIVDTIPKKLIIRPLPELCIYDHFLNLSNYTTAGYKGGIWSYPRNWHALPGNYLLPSAIGETTSDTNLGFIHYRLTGSPGQCSGEDSARIIIWPKVYAGPDATAWIQCGKYVLNNQYVTPRTGGKWTTVPGMPAAHIDYVGDSVLFYPDSTPGIGKYGFIYTYNNSIDTAACFGSDTVFITVAPKPAITIAPIGNLCDDANPVTINITPPGGHLEFADTTNPLAISGSKIIPLLAGPGYHRLKYVIKNIPGCDDTAGIGFYVVPPPDGGFHTADSSWTYCRLHNKVRLVPNTPGGNFFGNSVNNIGANYYFNPAAINADSNAVTTRITYYLPYNHNQCGAVYSHDITVLPNPYLKIIDDTFMCGNDNVFPIHGTANNCIGYYWSSPDANGQDAGTFSGQTTHYAGAVKFLIVNYIPGAAQLKQKYFIIYLTGWGAPGCDTFYTQLKIHIKPGPQPNFISQPLEGCDPLAVHFKNRSYDSTSNITKYEWDFGDTSPISNDVNPVHIYHVNPGDSFSYYAVKLTAFSADGCSNSHGGNAISVFVFASPVPIISADPTFTTLDKPKVKFSLSPQSRWLDAKDTSNIYLWHFLPQGLDTGGYSILQSPEHIYTDTGKFTVTLKVTVVDDASNCTGTDSAYAIVDIRPTFAIFIPNVFIPGSRFNKNQTFKPVCSSFSDFSMIIFSRWGNLVYLTNDPNFGWDGRILGQAALADVYVYKIEVKDLYGKTYKYTGNVTLMR